MAPGEMKSSNFSVGNNDTEVVPRNGIRDEKCGNVKKIVVPRENERFQQPIIWKNVFLLVLIHLWALYSITKLPFLKWQTWIWFAITYVWGGFGGTGGAHRYWTHRTFKASLPLQIILMVGYESMGMNTIFDWVRDHRIHHKFSDTDADPHNATRGLFFSHVGWLMMKKHPEVIRRGRELNMDDIRNDPICRFERKYHPYLVLFFCFILQAAVPLMFWQESWVNCWSLAMFRWVLGLNIVWSVNSFAHIFGDKPFNKNIFPSQNPYVSFWAMGEGWHNYHHVFPWDFKTSESGFLNLTMHLIRMFSALGLASDLKTASPELVERVVRRYGDGSRLGGRISATPEIPRECAEDISLVDTLPAPECDNHVD